MTNDQVVGTTAVTVGGQRIQDAFKKRSGSAALMPYMMGGFPTVKDSHRIAEAYVSEGADLIELGIPYSDPLADGPVIHAAGVQALANGCKVTDVLQIASSVSSAVPVVLMCYANLVFRPGVGKFVASLADAGVSGLIVPDLTVDEESEALRGELKNAGLSFVPLQAPTTNDERAQRIADSADGFIYAVSVAGTTGERSDRGHAFKSVIDRAKAKAKVPVGLGFGISNGQDAAAAAAAGADGVIVGSRLVRAASEADPEAAVRLVMSDLASGLKISR